MSGRPDLAPGGLEAPKGAPIVPRAERCCAYCGEPIPWRRRPSGQWYSRWMYARIRFCSQGCGTRAQWQRQRAQRTGCEPTWWAGRAARLRGYLQEYGFEDTLGVAVCAALIYRRLGQTALRRFLVGCAEDRWRYQIGLVAEAAELGDHRFAKR